MCGIFAISDHPESARMAYFGLYALQHRGQESAGIATCYDRAFEGHKANAIRSHGDMGLVPDVFTEQNLDELTGNMAIGHVRYSTAGSSVRINTQPIVVRVRGIEIALAHNGNLVNVKELRAELESKGSIFQSDSDSEIFVHLIAHCLLDMPLEEAVLAACDKAEGAFSLVIMSQGKIIALRDPHGFHPLAIGRTGESYVVASETCAFDLLEAEYIRSIEPGEMLIIDQGELKSRKLLKAGSVPVRQCIFELVYFARPDSIIFDETVYSCRKRMGSFLADEARADADLVMPFPDSGIYSAVGYAERSKIPYEHAFIRNHYVGRTFIQPTQSMRNFGVRVKLNPVQAIIKGKSVCVLDDSIVRGTTVTTRVAKLREFGVKEVHFRVACPPVRFPCFYGVDFATSDELVANNYEISELPSVLNLDSLHYLSMEGLKKAVNDKNSYCCACFDGQYPTKLPSNSSVKNVPCQKICK